MPGSKPPRVELGPSSRIERLDFVREFFIAGIEGRVAGLEPRMFVAGGGLSWLLHGGDIARDFWRVTAPKGSHETVQVVAACLQGSSAMRDAIAMAEEAQQHRRVYRFDDE